MKKEKRTLGQIVIPHLYSLILALVLFIYGVDLFKMDSLVILVYPPLRYLLILACLIFPIVSIIGILRKNRRLKSWGVILMGATWAVIGYLYWIHPFYTHGQTLALGLMGITWATLLRGGNPYE